MQTFDQGVVICVTSLVMALAQDHLEAYSDSYAKAADRLSRVRSWLVFDLFF
jgi:AP-2 complex subunit alpha